MVVDMALAAGLIYLDGHFGRTPLHADGWPGARRARCGCAVLADARSLSPQETSMRLIWVIGRAPADAEIQLAGRPTCDGRRLGRARSPVATSWR